MTNPVAHTAFKEKDQVCQVVLKSGSSSLITPIQELLYTVTASSQAKTKEQADITGGLQISQ